MAERRLVDSIPSLDQAARAVRDVYHPGGAVEPSSGAALALRKVRQHHCAKVDKEDGRVESSGWQILFHSQRRELKLNNTVAGTLHPGQPR